MKLRNKKTGEIALVNNFLVCDVFSGYKTLSDFLEDWEDSEPKEPLIKDKKVCKAVRAWAEANKINKCKCSDETHCITFETERGMFISFEYAGPIPPEGIFTIAELCGTPEPLEPTFVDLDERVKEKGENANR